MGVVPRTTNDLSVCMHLSDDVFGKDLGILVVASDAIVVVHVKALPNFSNVRKRHGPQIGVALIHGAIQEK